MRMKFEYKKMKVRPKSWLIVEHRKNKKATVETYVAYTGRVNKAV